MKNGFKAFIVAVVVSISSVGVAQAITVYSWGGHGCDGCEKCNRDSTSTRDTDCQCFRGVACMDVEKIVPVAPAPPKPLSKPSLPKR
jgi:hypothetical protein